MGLLDDAIREHLELKRRSGEDSRRLAQLEHEAFGPIRRGDPALDLKPPGEAAQEDAPESREAQVPPVPVEDDRRDDDEFEWVADEPESEDEDEPAFESPTAREPEFPVAPEPEPPAPAPQPPVAREPESPAPREPEAPAPGDQPTAAYSLSDLEELRGGDQRSLLDDPSPAGPPSTPPTPEPPAAPEPPVAREPQPPAAEEPVVPPQDVVPADDEPGEHDVLEETPEFLEETPEHDRLWFEQKPPRDFDF